MFRNIQQFHTFLYKLSAYSLGWVNGCFANWFTSYGSLLMSPLLCSCVPGVREGVLVLIGV